MPAQAFEGALRVALAVEARDVDGPRLQAAFDMEATQPDWALAYKFDIVLRGRRQSVFENRKEGM